MSRVRQQLCGSEHQGYVAQLDSILGAVGHSESGDDELACPAALRCIPVAGVEGAFVVRQALTEEECCELGAFVENVHKADRLLDPSRARQSRRDSQLHLKWRVTPESLSGLCARLRPVLPAKAGPTCECTLEEPSRELSSFIRTYSYEASDFSAPHFDRSFRVTGAKGELLQLTCYSVVLYLNDDFDGGHTTFFKEGDVRILKSRKGNTPVITDKTKLEVAARVAPKRGDALIFPHGSYVGCYPDPLHEGSVVTRGRKNIIRTDIQYVFHKSKGKSGVKRQKVDQACPSPKSLRLSDSRQKFQKLLQDYLRKAVAQVCPAFLDLVKASNVVFSEGPSDVEARSNISSEIFWTAFREQRKADKKSENDMVSADSIIDMDEEALQKKTEAKAKVKKRSSFRVVLTSDLGLDKELTQAELTDAIVAVFGDASNNIDGSMGPQGLAFVGVERNDSGKKKGVRIAFTSLAHAKLQAERGLLLCRICGKFAKSHNGGLEWHMKQAHNVLEHATAYDAVESTRTAIVAVSAVRDVLSVHGSSPFASAKLEAKDMADAIKDRALLAQSVANGRIKSLGSTFLDACRSGDMQQVKECIKDKIDPKTELDQNGSSGLLWAAGFGNLDVLKVLVKEGGMDPCTHVQFARRGYSRRHALHWAARNGHLDIARWLVEEQSFPVDKPSGDGTTALCLAVWQNQIPVIEYLLTCGADPHLINSYGCNAAMWAAQGGALEASKLLFTLGVDFNRLNDNGQGCLHKAAQRGSEDLCHWLVETGKLDRKHFAPNASEKSVPSTLARFGNHEKLAAFLLELERSK